MRNCALLVFVLIYLCSLAKLIIARPRLQITPSPEECFPVALNVQTFLCTRVQRSSVSISFHRVDKICTFLPWQTKSPPLLGYSSFWCLGLFTPRDASLVWLFPSAVSTDHQWTCAPSNLKKSLLTLQRANQPSAWSVCYMYVCHGRMLLCTIKTSAHFPAHWSQWAFNAKHNLPRSWNFMGNKLSMIYILKTFKPVAP